MITEEGWNVKNKSFTFGGYFYFVQKALNLKKAYKESLVTFKQNIK